MDKGQDRYHNCASSSTILIYGQVKFCYRGPRARLVVNGMTYKAYIDNIRAQTGKGPEEYRRMAKEKGLQTHAELLKWLKTDCGLGHGHANAMILYIRDTELAKKKIAEDERNEKAQK